MVSRPVAAVPSSAGNVAVAMSMPSRPPATRPVAMAVYQLA